MKAKSGRITALTVCVSLIFTGSVYAAMPQSEASVEEAQTEAVVSSSAEEAQTEAVASSDADEIENVAPSSLGNDTINIRNGGYLLSYDGKSLVADETGIYFYTEDGEQEYVYNDPAANLNAMSGYIYYTCGNLIKKLDTESGEVSDVYEADAEILRMYVQDNNLIKFVSGGRAFIISTDESGSLVAGPQEISALSDVSDVIPTEHGDIIITGSFGDYEAYVADELIYSDFRNYYEKEDVLVITNDEGISEIDVASLFETAEDGETIEDSDLSDYSLGEDVTTAEFAEILEEADETIEEAAEEGEEPEEFFEEIEGEVQNEQEEAQGTSSDEDSSSDGVSALSADTSLYEVTSLATGSSDGTSDTLTTEQSNVVNRAYSLAYLEWTALADITGWKARSANNMTAGTKYTGIPYSQPYTSPSGYVGYGSDVLTPTAFYQQTQNKNSLLYTKVRTIGSTKMPYYGTDCSGFVSYAWGLSRMTTWTIAKKDTITLLGSDSNSLYEVQVGDALNKASSHVVLVTDIKRDEDGEITQIEITEQTTPFTKVTTYTSIAKLAAKYSISTTSNDDGYALYRCTTMGSKAAEYADTSYTIPSSVKLTGVSYGTGSITVSWEAVSGASGYRLFRKEGANGSWKSIVANTTSIKYTDTSASYGVTYYYTVRAYFGDYTQASKNTYSSTYWSGFDSSGIKGLLSLATPTLSLAVNVTLGSKSGVQITWKSVSGAKGYTVFRKTASSSWKRIVDNVTGTTYTDRSCSSGTTYYYTVRAYSGTYSTAHKNRYNSAYWSGYNGSGIKATYVATPTLKKATTVSGGIKITWCKIKNAKGYTVFRKTGKNGSWARIVDKVTGSSYTDKTAKKGTTYYYTVRAYTGSYSDAHKNRYSSLYWSSYDATGLKKKR